MVHESYGFLDPSEDDEYPVEYEREKGPDDDRECDENDVEDELGIHGIDD